MCPQTTVIQNSKNMSHSCVNSKSRVFQILAGMLFLLCLSLCLESASTATPTGTETDLHALLAFKSHIAEDPFHIMSSWNDSIHHCNWTGITSNIPNRRVIYLILEEQRLAGIITPFIGNLTFLSRLNLSHNSFHGEFPQEVGRLLYLLWLDVEHNNFGGRIPTNLSHCAELTRLNFRRNNFEGTIPTWIGNLSSLTFISLVENNFHGNIPHEVGRLSSLTSLGLSVNHLVGTIPSSIYNISSLSILAVASNHLHGNIPADIGFTLPNLQEFLCWSNNFTGTIPASLLNASKLEMLDFGTNGLTGTIPKNIGILHRLTVLNSPENRLGTGKGDDLNFLHSLVNCTNLAFVDLSFNNFGGELPSSIANFSTQLQWLDLGVNRIQGNIPAGIGNLVNMTVIGLEGNRLTGIVPDSIGMLQNLEELYLDGNKLSGRIPSSLGNLSSLTKLSMEDNDFEGSIPSSLGNCQKLLLLSLYRNKLSGTIPKEVMSISSLSISLDVSHNALSGALPTEVGKLIQLGKLDLSENNFSGVIPSSLGSCISLERLHLQGNYFEGSIPQALQNLRGLQDIDLSCNNLSGEIPGFLGDFIGLQHLNLSYNNLEGELPKNGMFIKNATAISIYLNKKLCGGAPELNLPICTIKKTSLLRKFLTPKVVIPVVCASLFLLILSCFLVNFLIKGARNKTSRLEDLELGISYSVIEKCTNEFSEDNLIGIGSFGSVYKGILSSDGPTIAIKVLNLEQRGASRSFISECQVLRNTRHRNLLKIITVISSIDQGNDFKALVFEFMSKGSLEDWLHPINNMHKTLTFIQRLEIAIDVACALEYLHHFCQPPIVHCDIKPSNVLLDNDTIAHLGDFGLATFLFEESTISASLKGSIGYIPPVTNDIEYGMAGHPSELGDIYSYGILLLEIFIRKRPTDEIFQDGMGIHKFTALALPNHAMDIVDPLLLSEQESDDRDQEISTEDTSIRRRVMEPTVLAMREDWLVSVLQIGVSCSSTSPTERLPMTLVVNKLQAIKNSYLRFNKLQQN